MAADAKSEFSIHPEVEALRGEAVRNRRHFHEVGGGRARARVRPALRADLFRAPLQNPELSFEEVETAKYVASCLRSYGIEVTEGVGRTGVVGMLRGQSDRPCVGAPPCRQGLGLRRRWGRSADNADSAWRSPARGHGCPAHHGDDGAAVLVTQ